MAGSQAALPHPLSVDRHGSKLVYLHIRKNFEKERATELRGERAMMGLPGISVIDLTKKI